MTDMETVSSDTGDHQPPLEDREKKRVFLVDNPVSGTTDAVIRRETFLQHFEKNQWECEVYETKEDENLTEVVRKAVERKFDLVVASGGDGTVAGVSSGLVNSDVPMGIIPAGTGNILARDLNYPLRLDRALEVLTGEHDIVPIDAIQVGEKIYMLNLGVGISSQVMAKTDREQKRKYGMLAYVWTIIAQLTGIKLRSFFLQVDGKPMTVRASEIIVVNSSIIGVQKMPANVRIDPHDGKLDVCIVRAQTALDLASLAFSILLGQRRSAKIRCLSATKEIVIRSDRLLTVQADGEVIGKTPVEAKVLPGALHMIMPKKTNG